MINSLRLSRVAQLPRLLNLQPGLRSQLSQALWDSWFCCSPFASSLHSLRLRSRKAFKLLFNAKSVLLSYGLLCHCPVDHLCSLEAWSTLFSRLGIKAFPKHDPSTASPSTASPLYSQPFSKKYSIVSCWIASCIYSCSITRNLAGKWISCL